MIEEIFLREISWVILLLEWVNPKERYNCGKSKPKLQSRKVKVKEAFEKVSTAPCKSTETDATRKNHLKTRRKGRAGRKKLLGENNDKKTGTKQREVERRCCDSSVQSDFQKKLQMGSSNGVQSDSGLTIMGSKQFHRNYELIFNFSLMSTKEQQGNQRS